MTLLREKSRKRRSEHQEKRQTRLPQLLPPSPTRAPVQLGAGRGLWADGQKGCGQNSHTRIEGVGIAFSETATSRSKCVSVGVCVPGNTTSCLLTMGVAWGRCQSPLRKPPPPPRLLSRHPPARLKPIIRQEAAPPHHQVFTVDTVTGKVLPGSLRKPGGSLPVSPPLTHPGASPRASGTLSGSPS